MGNLLRDFFDEVAVGARIAQLVTTTGELARSWRQSWADGDVAPRLTNLAAATAVDLAQRATTGATQVSIVTMGTIVTVGAVVEKNVYRESWDDYRRAYTDGRRIMPYVTVGLAVTYLTTVAVARRSGATVVVASLALSALAWRSGATVAALVPRVVTWLLRTSKWLLLWALLWWVRGTRAAWILPVYLFVLVPFAVAPCPYRMEINNLLMRMLQYWRHAGWLPPSWLDWLAHEWIPSWRERWRIATAVVRYFSGAPVYWTGVWSGYAPTGPQKWNVPVISYLWYFARFDVCQYDAGVALHNTTVRRLVQIRDPEVPARSNPAEELANEHVHAARARNTVRAVVAEAIQAHTWREYCYSSSPRDQQQGREGYRIPYTSYDLGCRLQFDPLTPEHVVSMIDVDYYLSSNEMATILLAGRPVMLYTFVPEGLSAMIDGGLLRADRDDYWTYTLAGGRNYRHKLWDWTPDEVFVQRYWGTAIVKILRYRLDSGRVLVTLVPRVLTSAALRDLGGVPPLSRVRVWDAGSEINAMHAYHSTNRVADMEEEGVMHLSYAGGEEVSLPDSLFDDLVNSDKALQGGTVTRAVIQWASTRGCETPNFDWTKVANLVRRYRGSSCVAWNNLVVVSGHYQVAFRDMPTDRKENTPGQFWLKALGAPTDMGPCAAPVRGRAADLQAYAGRIANVRPMLLPANLQTEYGLHVSEFRTRLLCGKEATFVPLTFDEVNERQDRACQRRSFEQMADYVLDAPMNDRGGIEDPTFIKPEAYLKVSDPRIINNVNAHMRILFAAFAMPLSDYLKTMPWYAFGHSPVGVAEKVHQVCKDARFVVETDFSRFDGSLSPYLRGLEQGIFYAAYAKTYHPMLRHCLDYMYGQVTMGASLFRFLLGWARRSGAADTSCSNTIINAFTSFVALYETFGSYHKAWNSLGLYGGDDGLTPDVDPEKYTAVCRNLSLNVKANVIRDGHVCFLARIYPDPWASCGSFCDIRRQLSKIGYSGDSAAKPELVAWRKAISLWITDCRTPLVREVCLFILTRQLGYMLQQSVGCKIVEKRKPWVYDLIEQEQLNTLTTGEIMTRFDSNGPAFPSYADHSTRDGDTAMDHYLESVNLVADLNSVRGMIDGWAHWSDVRALFDDDLPATVAAIMDDGPVGPAPADAETVERTAKSELKAHAKQNGPVRSERDQYDRAKQAATVCYAWINHACTRANCRFTHEGVQNCPKFHVLGTCDDHSSKTCPYAHSTCKRKGCNGRDERGKRCLMYHPGVTLSSSGPTRKPPGAKPRPNAAAPGEDKPNQAALPRSSDQRRLPKRSIPRDRNEAEKPG